MSGRVIQSLLLAGVLAFAGFGSGCAAARSDLPFAARPPASSTPTVGPLPAAPSVPPQTTVTFRVANCEGCIITAAHAVPGHIINTDYEVATDVVRGGRAELTVDRSATIGMSFSVRNVSGGYQALVGDPYVVVGFGGRPPGTKVSPSAAALQRTGSWCWAGTKESHVTISLQTLRLDQPGAEPARVFSVWASPTLDVPINAANLKLTYRGGIGIEGVPYCGPGL